MTKIYLFAQIFFLLYSASLFSQVPGTPIPISPGSLEPPGDKVNNNSEITFSWNAVPDADSYAFYISRKDNKGGYNLIYSSEESSLIEGNSASLPAGFFAKGNSYRWNLRAFNSRGWSGYSLRLYFTIPPGEKIINDESFYFPNIIYPGYANEPGEEIDEINPVFKWNKIIGTQFYSLYVSRKNSAGDYELIFNSFNKEKIIDTFYVLPFNLERGEAYRWNYRGYTDKWSHYSERKYFKIKDEAKPVKKAAGIKREEQIESRYYSDIQEEVLLSLKYLGIVDTTIYSIYFGRSIYLPAKSFLRILKIPFDDLDNSFEFSFPENKKTVVDLDEYKIFYNGSFILLDENNSINRPDDIYLSSELLEEVLGIGIAFRFSNLSIKIESREHLPVYQDFLRKQNYKLLKKDEKDSGMMLYPLRKKWIAGGIFDYQLSSFFGKYLSPFYNYNFAVGGELAGGESKIELDGSYIDGKNIFSNFNYFWNYVVDKNYLKRVTIGNQFVEGLNTYFTETVTLTNEPVTPRRIYNQISLSDAAPPFSTVELYVNGKLYDFIRISETGRYDFPLTLPYGTTSINTIIYTDDGRVTQSKRLFQVPVNFLPAGELNYKISYGKYANTKNQFALATTSLGINNWLTNIAGAEYLENNFSKDVVFLNSLKARIYSNYILNFTAAPKVNYFLSLNALTPNLSAFSLLLKKHEKNLFYNPSGIRNEISANIFTPFYFHYPLNIGLSGRYMEFSRFKSYEYKIEAGAHMGSFHPLVEFRGIHVENQPRRLTLAGGFLLSIPRMEWLFDVFKGNLFSARTGYNISSRQMDNLYLAFSTTVFKYSRIQLSYITNYLPGGSNLQLQLITELPFTRSTTFATKNLYSQTFQGSLNYDMPNERFYFYNRTNTGRASAVINMFVDSNNNGKYEPGEEKIKGGRIILDGASIISDTDGYLYFKELNAYTPYSVTVDESGIKNPLLMPSVKAFSFIAEPNKVKQLDIPFYTAGEISGAVYTYIENERKESGGYEIFIEDTGGNIIKIKTFGDGTFYYFGVKPGYYKIYINPNQLANQNKESVPEDFFLQVNAAENNNFVSDIIFELK